MPKGPPPAWPAGKERVAGRAVMCRGPPSAPAWGSIQTDLERACRTRLQEQGSQVVSQCMRAPPLFVGGAHS
jgi:hypothetical protein